MQARIITLTLVIITTATMAGCVPGPGATGAAGSDTSALVADVSAKAEDVAQQVGGPTGFGGEQLNGYRHHFGSMMGFRTMGDLADAHAQMQVRFHNETNEECTFHLVYVASSMGLDEQMEDVRVDPGQTLSVDIPCAEMLGLGSMTETGEAASELSDGRIVDNQYCVPGFMHADYDCSGTFDCYLGPDEDDIDGDGDRTELIATTEALYDHVGPGGMMGHGHGGMGR